MAPICTPRFPLAQIFYSLFASLSFFSSGLCLGWAVQTILNTSSRTWTWGVWHQEIPWILATVELGSLMATLPAGYAMDKYGRKYVIVTTGFLFLLSWLIVLAADMTPENLYSARVVAGLGMGATAISVPTYVAEITEARVRGFLLTSSRSQLYLGLLTMHCIGPYTSYRALVGISSLAPVLFLVTFSWSPESPYILAMQEKWNKATENLQSLRGSMDSVKGELDELNKKDDEKVRIPWHQLYRLPVPRVSLLLSLCFTTLSTLSGFSGMTAYSGMHLPPTSDPAFLTPENFIVTVTGVMFGSCFLSAFFMDIVGRRIMYMTSSAMCTLSMLAAGFFYYRASDCSDSQDSCGLGWWVLPSLLVWSFSYGVGLCSIPSIITTELSPTNARSITVSFVTGVAVFMSFFCTKMFETVVSSGMGLQVIYWAYAGFSFLCFCFAFLFMPETKGKKLSKIQKEMNERYGPPRIPEVRQNGREMAPIREDRKVPPIDLEEI